MILLTAAALATAGCGDDDEASSPEGAVEAYNEAVADGDGERACGYLDQAAQEELRQATQGDARGSCPQIIDLLSAFYDDATKDRLRDAKVEAATRGDRAAARLNSPAGFGGPNREQTIELRRVGDEWKIVSLGLTIETPPEAP
jgi:hypothetical protein